MQLIHDDCLVAMVEIPDTSVDMVLADIPYDVVNRKSGGLRNLDKGNADVLLFSLEEMMDAVCRVCSGSVYIFCGTEQVSVIRAGLVNRKLSTRLCIWQKSNPSPMNGQLIWLSGIECCVFGRKSKATFNEHCKNTVWRYPVPRKKLHPTMKPLKLIEYLVSVSSNKGDTVLDFVMGSGTTGVACVNLGREFIGIEKDAGYFKIASTRIGEAVENHKLRSKEDKK